MRESRHIWVGNLPETVREEQIQDYFSRFGRVEKVKLLQKTSPDGGKAAFVDFVDIRSATKANEAQNRMGDRDLRTNYNEPGGNKQQHVQHLPPHYGNFPPVPGIPYGGQPVVIYAAPPPGSHIIPAPPPGYPHPGIPPPPAARDGKIVAPFPARRERSSTTGVATEGGGSPTRRSSDSEDDGTYGNHTIIVQNLVARTSDPSLEEALYHEFKKHGPIINIRIKGTGADRSAYVKFMRPETTEIAMRDNGKMFLGQEMKITVKVSRRAATTAASGGESGATAGGAVGTQLEEFDPHATRTVFIGNLEKTVSHGELRGVFESFGDVVDVDIKKMQTGLTTYAFVQFIDVQCAMHAKRKMDRQFLGVNRLKVGYGRGTPTNSLWVGGLSTEITDHELMKAFNPFGFVQRTLIDKKFWQGLVRFETIEACTRAYADMHGKELLGRRLLVDYASPACRDGFYTRMERNGLLDRRQLDPSPTPPDAHLNFQNVSGRGGRPPFIQPRVNVAMPPYVPLPHHIEPPRDYDYRDRERERERERERRSEYDRDLREYGAARERDRYRSRRGSTRSRDSSSSPKRRRSRDSASPMSSISFHSDRKKTKKDKRRKRDDSGDERRKKKKKKERKEVRRREKERMAAALKGTIDLGYSINDDEHPNCTPPAMKSKMEMKREKKERKRAEKAEKERRKAEKKQRKLEKKQAILAPMAQQQQFVPVNFVDMKVEQTGGLIKTEHPIVMPTPVMGTDIKLENPENNHTLNPNGIVPGLVPTEGPVDSKMGIIDPSKPLSATDGSGLPPPPGSEAGAVASDVKTEPINGDDVARETEGDVKVNGIGPDAIKTEPSGPSPPPPPPMTENNGIVSAMDVKPMDIMVNSNINNGSNVIMTDSKPKPVPFKKRKPIGKDSSDSSSSSSSSSSDSDDSDDSSDDDDDAKHRAYRNAAKDRQRLKKESELSKSREPKAYRQGPSSDYSRDRDRGSDRYSDRYKYGSDRRSRSPASRARDKLRSRSNSPIRRSRSPSGRRSRSPYDRRRMRSPPRSTLKPMERPERKDLVGLSRTVDHRTPPPAPPHPPPKDDKQMASGEVPGMYPTSSAMTVGGVPTPYTTSQAMAAAGTGGGETSDTLPLLDLLRRFPVMWQGFLGLKNDSAAVQMHFLSGNVVLAESSLPRGAQPHDVSPPLRISQRMKLEPSQLEGVEKRIQVPKEHCMLLALPCGRDPLDVHAQTRALKTGFITYLQQKQAAGIINVTNNKVASFVVHIFPPCEFAQGHLARVAPDLLSSAADSGHLMVLITPL